MVSFAEIYQPLKDLIERYGPSRANYHPEYPFWWLQNDGLWEVESEQPMIPRTGNTNPSKPELFRKAAKGGFPAEVYEEFSRSPALVEEAVRRIAESHFPDSMREDLLRDLSLSDPGSLAERARDASFRADVIQAYEHRCAVCGYDARLGGSDLALEAAHIFWHQAGGPDIVQNGLALCALHHKAFDRGAIGVNEKSFKIKVSADVHGGDATREWFLRYKDRELRPPHSGKLSPDARFVAWHSKHVFREPARA